jgi:2-polyprenyl-6-methoxyphenol hydroxylase-like FAD-dependent oxidoreductase
MDCDVVVAGAGPVGLLLADELALAGVRVRVVERLAELDLTIKAGSINIPTGEALYRRGFLPALERAHQRTAERMGQFLAAQGGAAPARSGPAPRFVGHFAAMMLDGELVDPTDPEFAGHGPVAGVAGVGQQDLEAIFAERAAELGVRVDRGVALTGFSADDDGVTVEIGGGERIRAGWLVGCDGGRSVVRRLAGFDFPGTDPEITGHQALVELADTDGLRPGWNRTDTGVYVLGPVPGRILTVEFSGPPIDRDAPITAAELQDALRATSGSKARVTAVHSATRWTDNTRQATTYRMGRVLLAGDAAHVHSPFGGQGLNLGVGDAMNLGWKLAATVRGWAPDGLLDTYTAERHPVGEWVLDWTRAQVALMRPDPRTVALRAVVGDLAATVAGTTYFAKKLSGVWQRLDLGGDHPLVGASAPDLELADGGTLAGHLHAGTAVLVDLADDPALADAVREVEADYPGRVEVVRTRCAQRPELAGLLVRPDGFVAWAADTGPDPDAARAGLVTAVRRWSGAPAAQPVGLPAR